MNTRFEFPDIKLKTCHYDGGLKSWFWIFKKGCSCWNTSSQVEQRWISQRMQVYKISLIGSYLQRLHTL